MSRSPECRAVVGEAKLRLGLGLPYRFKIRATVRVYRTISYSCTKISYYTYRTVPKYRTRARKKGVTSIRNSYRPVRCETSGYCV